MRISLARVLMSSVLVAALLFTLAPVAYWSEQAFASLPTSTLHAVTFVPGSDVVVAVGASGTILRSEDGGRLWASVGPGGAHEFRGVSFADANRGWALTRAGALYRTIDGGTSWAREYSGVIFPAQDTSSEIFDLVVVQDSQGSGTGYIGLAAGRSGSESKGPATVFISTHLPRTATLYGEWPYHFSAKEYWESGDYTEPGPYGTGTFNAIDVWMGSANPERAWAVGIDEHMGRNDGAVWTEAYDPTSRFTNHVWTARQDKATFTNSGPLHGVSFGSATHGIVVGTAGKAWRTTNGGSSWTAAATGVSADFNAVAMTDASWGWAVAKSGQVARTQNGGASWSLSTVANTSLEDVATPGSGSRIAVAVGGSGRIYRTTDGVVWTQVNPPPAPPTVASLEAPTHTPYSAWHAATEVTANWEPSNGDNIAGYYIAFDKSSMTEPSAWTTGKSANFNATSDGEWTIHVRAKDVWGQVGAVQRRTVRIDATSPAGSISINGGASTTYLRDVTVSSDISFGPSGPHAVEAMRYHDGTGWTGWEPYATSKQLTLPEGNGVKTVMAEFRDAAGNVSAGIQDTIELVDPPDPSTIDVQHDAAGVVFDRWVTGYSTAYSGDGYVYGRWTGTELTARFTGTKIRWVGPKQPFYGMADVYIDGVRVAENVDCYAPAAEATLEAVIWESGTLSDGPHTITLKLKGNRNASSTGNTVVLDRFEVDGVGPKGGGTRIDDAAATPGYTGSWISAINPTYYDKTYSYSRWPGHVFSVTFEGTKVAWLGPMTPFYGTAEIWLDGSYVTTVDAYRDYQGWRERIWESQTLSPGTHTLEIRPTGEKNPASTSANIVIDAIDVME